MNKPSPERRAWGASRFERFLAYYGLKDGLKAARENRPAVDLAVWLRRERRRYAGMAIWLIGFDVYWWVEAVPTPGTKIVGVGIAVMGVWEAGHVIVLTRRIKRGRGPSGFPPREAPMTDELPAEHRAKAAREDRGPE
jgi:hypothetical protein